MFLSYLSVIEGLNFENYTKLGAFHIDFLLHSIHWQGLDSLCHAQSYGPGHRFKAIVMWTNEACKHGKIPWKINQMAHKVNSAL